MISAVTLKGPGATFTVKVAVEVNSLSVVLRSTSPLGVSVLTAVIEPAIWPSKPFGFDNSMLLKADANSASVVGGVKTRLN